MNFILTLNSLFITETETTSPTGQLSTSLLYTTSINYSCPTYISITSSTLVGSIIASIIATSIVTVIIMSSVFLCCWKRRKEKKTSSVPTDSNPVVLYDEVKVDESVTDSVQITDNPAYSTPYYY